MITVYCADDSQAADTGPAQLPKARKEDDNVYNHSRRVLEIGMLMKALLYLCKTPDRHTMLSLLKLFLPMLYHQSRSSKYAQEIIRFLVHQHSLSPREANETFYKLFVNSAGKYDSHIPADLAMEHIVKRQKTYVMPMCSGRTERNVDRHTSAMCGMNSVADNFDKDTVVLNRSNVHKQVDSVKDEKLLITELRSIQPFKKQGSRQHDGIGRISVSGYAGLDINEYKEWLKNKQRIYLADL